MHVMVRHYGMGTGSIDDLMHKVDTEFADRLQRDLGIIGYQAIDVGNGEIMTITVFETAEQLQHAQAAAEGVRQGLAEFKVEQIDAWAGEVMVSRSSEKMLAPVHH